MSAQGYKESHVYLVTKPFTNFVFTRILNRLMGAEGGRRVEIRVQVTDCYGREDS